MKLTRWTAALTAVILALPALAQSDPCDPDGGNKGAPRNVLWDRWYVVAANQKTPFAAFNERAELKPGRRVEITTRTWKKVGSEKWEENLVIDASYDNSLAPSRFTLTSTREGFAGTFTGEVKSNRLVVTGPSENQLNLPQGAIFGSSFALWLRQRMDEFRKNPQAKIPFVAVPETDAESGFAPLRGIVRTAPPDAYARQTRTQRLFVQYGQTVAAWWVRPDGSLCRAVLPKQKTLIQAAKHKFAERYVR